MASVIIPAHNESSVIIRCCSAFIDGLYSGEVEIIVVCNGCTDNTANVVRSFDKNIKVIETEIASKSNAINIGDAYAKKYPRIYVDADVILSLESIQKLISVLKKDKYLVAAPKLHVDLTDRSWLIKNFYKVWLKLPYIKNGMIGSGIYALSEKGRVRIGKFPPIIADDGFVRAHFTQEERISLNNCEFTIFPPKKLKGIVDIKTRAHYGNIEMRKKFPELLKNDYTNHYKAIKELIKMPNLWIPMIVYSYVRIISRMRASYRFRRGYSATWDRDETSR